ncbi:MAG: hypothetical protein AAF797_02375 [Planctomycetota bacterium]
MNPIVVKELRQAVNSRLVVGVLTLMLAVLWLIMMIALLDYDPRGGLDTSAGAELFSVFQGVLLATCMLFVPVYVGVRLAAERASATADLLYVTTIRPSSVVWGKLLAGMVVTVLVFSACAPFMIVTYLMRGIDLPTILLVLGLDALVVLASTMLAIFVATLPVGWPVKALLGFVVLGASVGLYTGLTAFVAGTLLFLGVGSMLSDPDFLMGLASAVGSWIAAVGLVFFLAVALVSPAASNRALPVRVYITVMWAGTLGLFVYLCWWSGATEPLVAWVVGSLLLLGLASVVSVSEREEPGPRLRRSIPRSGLLRVPAFLFFSGAGGGLLWVSLLMVLTVVGGWWLTMVLEEAIWAAGGSTWDGFDDESLARTGAMLAWLLAYLLAGVLLSRRLVRFKQGDTATGVVALLLMTLGSLVPLAIAFAADPQRWDIDSWYWMLLNPLSPVLCDNGDWRGDYGQVTRVLSYLSLGVMVLFNLPWFAKQVRQFRPPPPPEETSAGDGVDGGAARGLTVAASKAEVESRGEGEVKGDG